MPHTCRCASHGPGRMLLRRSASGHLHKVGITTCIVIVGPAPRVLPLTPQAAFPRSGGRPRGSEPPALRILLRFRGHRRPPGASQRAAQSAIIHFPFHAPVALPERCSGRIVRAKPPDSGSPHWLTVAAFGLRMDRLCPPLGPKPCTRGHNSVRGWFVRPAPLVLFASRAGTARRLTS